jgi:hypothetical protein
MSRLFLFRSVSLSTSRIKVREVRFIHATETLDPVASEQVS